MTFFLFNVYCTGGELRIAKSAPASRKTSRGEDQQHKIKQEKEEKQEEKEEQDEEGEDRSLNSLLTIAKQELEQETNLRKVRNRYYKNIQCNIFTLYMYIY